MSSYEKLFHCFGYFFDLMLNLFRTFITISAFALPDLVVFHEITSIAGSNFMDPLVYYSKLIVIVCSWTLSFSLKQICLRIFRFHCLRSIYFLRLWILGWPSSSLMIQPFYLWKSSAGNLLISFNLPQCFSAHPYFKNRCNGSL